tara:strand:- start:2572 stop:3111 length:540 start_codon:yes stop_codon:yes gene_type:complete
MSLIRKILIGFVVGFLIGAVYTLYVINNPVSPLETVQLNEADDVSITYSRPYKNDRLIFGNASDKALVPYENYWRTGANRHTYMENNIDLDINGNTLFPGKYSIYTIPGENEWEVYFNTNVSYFGVSRPDESDDIFSIKVPVIKLLNEIEQFTIEFDNDSIFNYISLKWDLTKVMIPFK